jgi:hypothetical protein
MEPDVAPEAVDTMQAAPVAGADNQLEREKSAILDRMFENDEVGEVLVVEEDADGGQEQAAEAAHEEELAAARKQARDSVAKEFPEALAQGSELYEACREELAYLREANSPLANDPQAEYKIARRMARVLGLSQRPAAPAKNAPQRRSVRPMPTGGAPVESPVTTLERRVSGAKSSGDMLELMREIGTPFEALLKRN